MGAEQVVEKILADARAEAEKIKKQAEENLAAEQAKQAKQLDDYKQQTELLTRKAAETEKARVLSAARMLLAKEYLAEKTKILDDIFTKTQQQLKNLPDDKYRGLMAKLMLDAAETGDEEVIIDVNEKRIDQQLIDQVNRQLASKSKGSLKLSRERQQIGGGFILKKGKIKNNCSLKILLSRARDELEIELAKQLFGG
jgi:V/A-type H+-transporting ATPase subunit E